jgi:hypothetical protein
MLMSSLCLRSVYIICWNRAKQVAAIASNITEHVWGIISKIKFSTSQRAPGFNYCYILYKHCMLLIRVPTLFEVLIKLFFFIVYEFISKTWIIHLETRILVVFE